MRRFGKMTTGFIISLSLIASVLAYNDKISAKTDNKAQADEAYINDDIIEEDEIESKYATVSDDTLVKDIITDQYLRDELITICNNSGSYTANWDTFTYGQLKTIIDDYLTEDSTIAFTNTNITSIKGLGLLRDAESIDISKLNKVTTIPDEEFKDGRLTDFKLPDSVKVIGKEAFSGCNNLSKIILPSGLIELNEAAFSNCSNLSVVGTKTGSDTHNDSLPKSLTKVGQQVFANDVNLESITIPAFTGDTAGTLIENSPGLFFGCKKLSNIKIEDGITVIPESAFELAGVTSENGVNISFPETLVRIKARAFAGIYLYSEDDSKTIDLSEMTAFKNIDSEAFSSARNFERIILPDVTTLEFGDYAFAHTSLNMMYVKGTDAETEAKKEYTTDNGTVIEGLVFLPDSVKSVGTGCFYDNSNIKHISLSPNLTEIPDYTFDNCENLYDIKQRQDSSKNCSITLIGDCAFRGTAIADTEFLINMNKLNSIGRQVIDTNYTVKKGVSVYSSGVDTSSEYAFESIPVGGATGNDFKVDESGKKTYKSKECGSEVFSRCRNLKSIHIPASVKMIASRAFYYPINKKGTDTILSGVEEIIWESDDKTATPVDRVINSGAFQGNKNVSQIMLPYRAKDTLSIGRFAFACDESVDTFYFGDGVENEFPDTVTKIDTGAFYYCKALDTVSLKNTASGQCPELGGMIFWGCVSLEKAVLPGAITVIPDHMFYDAPIKEFTIGANPVGQGAGVEKIDNLAFFGNRIKTIDLSGFSNLQEIGAGAFSYLDMVNEPSYEAKDAKLGEADGASPVTEEVILPDKAPVSTNTIFINTGAFAGQRKLDTLRTATRGEEGTMYIPDYMVVNSSNGSGMGMFAETAVRKTVWQADATKVNVWTAIPVLMYFDCQNIERAEDVLPTGNYVTGIGQGAFQECNLVSADLSAYTNLEKLGTGSVGSSWYPKDAGVFHGCVNLTSAILPNSIAEKFVVGKNSFADCVKLKKINLGTVADIEEKAFQNDIELSELSYPETLKNIGNYAFSNCTSLDFTKDNNLPISLEKIGNYAFEKDSALSQVVFKSQLTEIGNNAFVDCTGLKTTDFTDATELTKIGTSAFQNTGLRDFRLLNSKVENIEGSVLKGCKALESAVFGSSVVYIKSDAICGCPNFKSLRIASTTIVDRKIFNSGVDNKFTAENNDFSIAVLIDTPEEKTIPLGREVELPFYVNPKGTSAIASILIGKDVTDPSIQETLRVSASSANGYFWGTTKDTDGTHKITSEDYYNDLTYVGKYKNTDVDLVMMETLKPGKFDLIVTCGMIFDCAKKVNNVNTSITASQVNAEFKFNVEEMKFHPAIYSKYSNNTYAAEDKVATDAPIVIQASSRNNKGSIKYYYNMEKAEANETSDSSINTYDIVAVSSDPEVIEVSNTSSGKYPEGGYTTTNCTKVNTTTKEITAQNSNMYFCINPKKVGTASVTITAKGYDGKPDYQTVMTFDVKADIVDLKLDVPEEFKNGAVVGTTFNVFSSYKNIFEQTVDANNLNEMGVLSNNTISYESNYPEYVSVDEFGNVTVLNADKSNKSVRITAKTVDAATTKTATCDIKVLGTDNGSVNNGNGGNTGNNNSNNGKKDETPVNADGTYDDKSSKATVNINPASGEATYVRPTSDADATNISVPATVRVNGTSYKVTSFDASTFAGNTTVTKINVGSNITSIPDGAFAGCTAVTSISLPSTVTTIGSNAFAGCSALTSVTIPSKVVAIGDNTFNGCTSLKNISIPSTVTSIGANAFANCSGLSSITIPASVTSVGANAFKGCAGLTSASIGDGVTSIGSNAFNGCTKLTTVNVSDKAKLTTIGANAFYNCKSLTTVTIPKKVKTIGAKAFYNCKKLKTINVKSTSLKKIGKQAFKGIHKKAVINVPKKKFKKYKKLFKGKGQKKSVKMKKMY